MSRRVERQREGQRKRERERETEVKDRKGISTSCGLCSHSVAAISVHGIISGELMFDLSRMRYVIRQQGQQSADVTCQQPALYSKVF